MPGGSDLGLDLSDHLPDHSGADQGKRVRRTGPRRPVERRTDGRAGRAVRHLLRWRDAARVDYLPGDMPGITRLATYLPRRRLDRSHIARAWGSRVAAGSRTVAAVDEDALTMGIDAALACIEADDPAGFDALFFASTSAPYLEKQVASLVATAVDLPREAAAADFGG